MSQIPLTTCIYMTYKMRTIFTIQKKKIISGYMKNFKKFKF